MPAGRLCCITSAPAARTRDAAHARELLAAGASEVIPEALEAALQMGVHVLDRVGVDADTGARLIESERAAGSA